MLAIGYSAKIVEAFGIALILVAFAYLFIEVRRNQAVDQ